MMHSGIIQELQIRELKSAHLLPALRGGGVRLLIVYRWGWQNMLNGTSLDFPEASVARNWVQKYFPRTSFQDHRKH